MRRPSRTTLRHLGGVALLVLVVPFVVYAAPQLVGANHSYVVLSDSMSPDVRAGDVVVVDDRPPSTIERGDVITFTRASGDQLVTHRVVDVVERDGARAFRTKGDANEDADAGLVAPDDIVGVVAFHIPVLGYVITFVSSDVGIVLFVILPAVFLGGSELHALYVEMNSDRMAERGSDR